MERDPITEHIAAMSDKLGQEARRALYMVAKELYRLTYNQTTPPGKKQGKTVE